MHSHWIRESGSEDGQGDAGLIFPYWSFTKTALAICALKLAAAGRLDLDAPARGAAFTLRQLLRHSAGLPDYTALPDYRAAVAAQQDAWPPEVLIERAMAQGQLFAPGQGWAYSNLGYLLARQEIEAAAGQGLGALIATLICQPLGLSARLASRRADFAQVCWPAAQAYDPRWVYHGCLIGTARDAALLLQACCTGALLSASQRAQMQELHPLGGSIAGRPWLSHGYGLGLMIGTTAAGRMLGHSGSGPFSSNAVYHFADRRDPLTIACFGDTPAEGLAETEAVRLALQA